jgi:hypothetical protein
MLIDMEQWGLILTGKLMLMTLMVLFMVSSWGVHHPFHYMYAYIYICNIWLFNIAMENLHF